MEERLNLEATAAGAVLAILAGTLVGLVARARSGEPTDPGAPISAPSGLLLAYLPGGYLAGSISGKHGGLNGLSAAVAGFLLGVVVGVFLFAAGPGAGEIAPDSVNATGVAVAGLVSLALAFAGAYAGCELGERSAPRASNGRLAGKDVKTRVGWPVPAEFRRTSRPRTA